MHVSTELALGHASDMQFRIHDLHVFTYWPRARMVRCQAKKGQAYFEKYKANREHHAGVLLPPQPDILGMSAISQETMIRYLQEELWAYTYGQPSPHDPLPPTPSQSQGLTSTTTKDDSKSQITAKGAPGAIIPPPEIQPVVRRQPLPPLPTRFDRSIAQVHVFWDIASKHPGASDPRVVSARLSRLASRYGQVAGLYAYALRKDWNWVPEHFLQYRVDKGETGSGSGDADGLLRCPVCGAGRRTQPELDAHIKTVHPTRGNGAVAIGMAGVGPGLVTRNSSRRTVGKVSAYHTGSGKVVVPPSGKQLSLKYCLEKEGWEARIVQNAAEAESVAVASGMGRLLDKIRRGEGPGAMAVTGQVVVMLISEDEERLQQPLLRLRGVGGAATVAVWSGGVTAKEGFVMGGGRDVERGTGGNRGRGRGQRIMQEQERAVFRGADVDFMWEDVMGGVYEV